MKVAALLPRTPQGALVVGFAVLILVGAILLWLPCSHRSGHVGFLDAAFTSTSAVCVTGLVVVDTGRDFTAFGQLVILLLIQTGGLGVMTVAALAFRILGRRLSLTSQAAVQDSLLQRDSAAEFMRLFRQILTITILVETVGAALIFLALMPSVPVGVALWSSVFHSVSAFCNAGFSVYSDSLTSWRGNALFVGTVSVLVILGGLGHVVLRELFGLLRRPSASGAESGARGLSYHSRLVIRTSVLLLVAGWLGLAALGAPAGSSTWSGRVGGGLFQSISARTAGFNTYDIGGLAPAALLLLVFLMFVGGSPASCAGGVKTTTFAVWLAGLRARLAGRSDVTLMGRSIPGSVLGKAGLVIGLSLLWNLVGLLILTSTERAGRPAVLQEALFEQVSAFGTVGLSTGLTPQLSVVGEIWIALTMFVGRLGPLTLATWGARNGAPRVKYAEATVLIG